MNTLRARVASGARSGGMRRALLCGAALSSLTAMPSVAFAQDAETAEDGSEERVIIVQARRQNETLQEVPVTVTAIGGDTLQKYNIDQVADVVSRVPTLNVQSGGSGSGGQISLRGVGSSNISAAFDSAVAFEYDGVVVSTMRMVQAGFFDVEQIDVLRGPQSLFFGKSATAGVLSLRSANPTSTWEVGMRANYEFEEKGYLLSGYISGPVTDTLGIRVAAQFNDIDEFQLLQENTPAVNQKRGLTDFIGRLTLDWNPADRFRANFKLQYTKNENDGAIGTAEINCGANGVADSISLLGGALQIPAGYNCITDDQRYYLTDAAGPLSGPVPGNSPANGRNGVPFGETEIWFGRLQFDLDLSDTLTLTSVTGLLNMDAIDYDPYSYGGFFPGPNGTRLPGGAGSSDPINQLEQYSQELRLASDFDGAFNFMVGAFYEDRTFIFDTSQQAVNISFVAPDPVTGFTYDWDKTHTTKTEALSFFGSAMIDLTDKLELSGGIRWTDEQKVQTIAVPYLHTFLQGPGFVRPGFFSGPINFADDNFSPEVTLRYQATDDINVFASYKTGFKSGGIDNSALPSNSLSQAAISGDFSSLIFKSEEAEGGEVGFKSQWADRTFTLNATAFYYVFTDLQVQNFNASTIQFITSNAGELTTKGVDIESRWITPVDGLSFSANLSYLDAQYTDTFLQPGGAGGAIDLDGRRGSQAPEWAGNIAADWSIPLNDSLELFLSGNAAYNDGYITDEATLNDYVQPSFWLFDANVSIGHPDGNWKVSLVGQNLTDEIFTITSGGRPFLPPGGDDFVMTQNRGRQVFAEVSFKF
ncbi:TonB-dependent receptor [Porphyrobacter sp. LM 6]|uniref:TonB-dependent receptor n=1 Tax=Porphyrobacter sp. LM 6 TaxID=1896196 RepID=UPI000863C1B8|nr:TonB-dependent receptor [Porphyrobacter sp. LM 6]AOL93226.1 TonB-dependent outer membrane channel [Porphyrobacter sp. LM 6]